MEGQTLVIKQLRQRAAAAVSISIQRQAAFQKGDPRPAISQGHLFHPRLPALLFCEGRKGPLSPCPPPLPSLSCAVRVSAVSRSQNQASFLSALSLVPQCADLPVPNKSVLLFLLFLLTLSRPLLRPFLSDNEPGTRSCSACEGPGPGRK